MRRTGLVLLAAVLAACDITELKLRHSKEFQSYPPDIQAEIRAGEIERGFSDAQVRMALGEPDWKEKTGSDGDVRELWVYFDSSPKNGVGGVSFGGSSDGSLTGASSMGTSPSETRERIRVSFLNKMVVDYRFASRAALR